MSRTLNQQARDFALRELFLAEPDGDFQSTVASLAVIDLAERYAKRRSEEGQASRRVRQAMVIGVSKMVADGDAYAEMSARGVMFVRLSPQGVLSPQEWTTPPDWLGERPEAVAWARDCLGLSPVR